ncbi:hypothetical protein ACFOPQ_07720 [Deinococcus antarcticus]|uniref:Secreted protein n=1 Tax=Deinococcus antarcticus TaxID=1298767 RepID=A0ABV8A866_9DEIO
MTVTTRSPLSILTTTVCFLLCSIASAAPNLSLQDIVRLGYLRLFNCWTSASICDGYTSLPPNALAATLGLAPPNQTRSGWATGGHGWTVEMEENGASSWQVTLSPLGRTLTREEHRQYPERSPTPLPRATSSTATNLPVTALPRRDMAARVEATPGRAGQTSKPTPATGRGEPISVTTLLRCTVVIDVRGLGRFQRDMSSLVLDNSGRQL